MRTLQVVLFVLGVIAFFVAAVMPTALIGDIFWRVGMATMLTNVVIILLWSTPQGKAIESTGP